jgi:phage major head subunit gpT-like protein
MAPGLYDVIALAYKEYPDIYSKIFKVKTSSRKYEQNTGIEGLGAAAEKSEGNSVIFSDLTQGYDRTFTHKTYAIGSRITKEAYDDDLYSALKSKLGQYLARSMKQRWEIMAANVLNNGFTASYTGTGQTGGDAVALFSDSHPFASGGTYSNLLATAADLSATSLQNMITLMDKATEAGSIPIVLNPKTLIVSPENRWMAETILHSTQVPGSANNDVNTMNGIVNYIVDPYLTDTDAWFLMSDYNPLIFWERMRPTLETMDDFDTGDAKIKITGRCSAGFEDPMGIFGTPGA